MNRDDDANVCSLRKRGALVRGILSALDYYEEAGEAPSRTSDRARTPRSNKATINFLT